MKPAEQVKMVRMVSKWLRQNSPKQCQDALGIPMSSLTVVPKSIRHHYVSCQHV